MESVNKWDDVSQIQTEGVKIHDDQSGEVILIRKIDFTYTPLVAANKHLKPKKADILTKDYIKHLEIRLWGDALEMIEPYKGFSNPRVVFTKKGFTVVVACKPKPGNIIPYELLQQTDRPITERLIEREPQ